MSSLFCGCNVEYSTRLLNAAKEPRKHNAEAGTSIDSQGFGVVLLTPFLVLLLLLFLVLNILVVLLLLLVPSVIPSILLTSAILLRSGCFGTDDGILAPDGGKAMRQAHS